MFFAMLFYYILVVFGIHCLLAAYTKPKYKFSEDHVKLSESITYKRDEALYKTFLCPVHETTGNVEDAKEFTCPEQCYCKTGKKEVTCIDKNLTSLPDDLSPDTKLLDLSINKFSTLSNETFKNYSHIVVLYLKFNQIVTVGSETFAFLPKLCHLDISANPLSMSVLESSVFCALPQTSIKYLNVTRIKTLVNLTDKSMQCLRNTYLEIIDLSYGKFGALCLMQNGTFAGMLHLTQVYFTLLECDAFNTFALENASEIKKLDLSHNQLLKVPVFTVDNRGRPLLPHLECLYLDHNRIYNMDGTFKGLHNLKYLNLAHNNLIFLNNNPFAKLLSLKQLFLHNNRIKQMGELSLASPSLEHVTLYSNPLNMEFIPPKLFRHAQNIKSIFMGEYYGHNLTVLDTLFNNLHTLESLSVASVRMRYIPQKMLKGLYNLKYLRLTDNLISKIDRSVFQDLKSLNKLQLDYNLISNVNSSSFPHDWLNSLGSLDLSFNPWDCSCDLFWFKDWVQDNHSSILHREIPGQYMCVSPSDKAGTDLLHLVLTAEQCLTKHLSTRLLVSMLLSAAITLISFLVSGLYRFQWYVRSNMFYLGVWWRTLNQPQPQRPKRDCQYDVFVSYNSADTYWVKRALVLELEHLSEPPLKLCLFERDWLAGHDVVEHVLQSIDNSHKVLIIVTNAYAASTWCQQELTFAQNNQFESDQDNLILAVMEDIDPLNMSPRLAMQMKRRNCLTWSTGKTAQRLFWEKLMYIIKSPNSLVRNDLPRPEELCM